VYLLSGAVAICKEPSVQLLLLHAGPIGREV
jgi:hypothetical protein